MDDMCERCGLRPDHRTLTCCSSHNKVLCHRCYKRTHFVEVCDCWLCKAREPEEPQAVRAAFDAGPKGVTASSDHPMKHVTGVRYHASAMDAAQAENRRLTAALDAAERQIIRMSQPEYSADGLADGDRIDQLIAALDAAQNEIEKLLSEIAATRIERDDQEQVVIGRKLRTWYRAIGPGDLLWCETSNAKEAAQSIDKDVPDDYQPLRLEKLTYYEATTGWQQWDGDAS